MANETWLGRPQWHSVRFSHLGIGPDLAAFSVIEAWGLYRFLCGVQHAES